MESKPTTVRNLRDEEVAANMMICDNCKGAQFWLFALRQPVMVDFKEPTYHNHIQCTACGESYCQGGCEQPDPPIK